MKNRANSLNPPASERKREGCQRDVIDLNGTWSLRWTEGLHGQPELLAQAGWDECVSIPAQVPGEVHLDLQRAGLLSDVNIGLNGLAARWVEEQVWVYRREFTVNDCHQDDRGWLVFEGLDLNAVIYLNGKEVGRHANTFRPYRVEVTDALRVGENLLVVVLESGLYGAADRAGEPYCSALDSRLTKRSLLRKPQYVGGWDWSPRLMTVGIFRDVRLEFGAVPRLAYLVVTPELAEDHGQATLHARVVVENPQAEAVSVTIHVRVSDNGQVVCGPVDVLPGESSHSVAIPISNPRLWWPRGHGEQYLYAVECELEANGAVLDRRACRTGIRRVKIDQSLHPEEGKYFILEINDRSIFCKGGNWVPPDCFFGNVPAKRYRALIQLAAEANFNLLRIWGGGMYAEEPFLEACDEAGILVWHDFIFACAKYPLDDPAFAAEVRREAIHNIRTLASHPCLVVWCGNNELEVGMWHWGYELQGKALPDYAIFHHILPQILRTEDPSRPYWPSSPFSPDHLPPSDPTVGDQHPWSVSLEGDGPDFWAYRRHVDRFPNEGGVLGASSPATLRQFLSEGQRHWRSVEWEYHNNAANYWSPEAAICSRYITKWLGRDPAGLSFEDYCFYSALLQVEGLQEYIANFRRRMFSSSSAVFWMYNDSWPASQGWTIVDYYLRRKLSYYPVRRAFSPVTVVVAAEKDGGITVYGVNDSPHVWSGELQSGLFLLRGGSDGSSGRPGEDICPVTLPANAATPLKPLSRKAWEDLGLHQAGAFAILRQDERIIAQHRLLLTPFKDLTWAVPQIKMTRRGGSLTLLCEQFAWGVCLDLDGEMALPDNCFDLLPGVPVALP